RGTTAAVGAVIGLVLLFIIYQSHTHTTGEPFEFLEGLSIWPTVILRLLASVLCIYYVVDALGDLHERTAKIREEYHFGDATPTAPPAAKKEHPARHWRVWTYFVAWYRHPGTQFRGCCCSIWSFLYGS